MLPVGSGLLAHAFVMPAISFSLSRSSRRPSLLTTISSRIWDPLVGSEPALASQALSATPYAGSRVAGVDYLRVLVAAVRAIHATTQRIGTKHNLSWVSDEDNTICSGLSIGESIKTLGRVFPNRSASPRAGCPFLRHIPRCSGGVDSGERLLWAVVKHAARPYH